jgi:hypothetical protein
MDRIQIVECRIINDMRPRIVGTDHIDTTIDQLKSTTIIPTLSSSSSSATNVDEYNPMTSRDKKQTGPIIYIQRRLLSDVYADDVTTIYCQKCGQCLTSIPGYKYHINNSVCTKRSEVAKVAAETYMKDVDERITRFMSSSDSHLRDIHGRFKCGSLQQNVCKLMAPDDGSANKMGKKSTPDPSNIPSSSSTNKTDDDVFATILKPKNPVVYIFSQKKEDGTAEVIKVEKQNKTKLEEISEDLVSPNLVLEQLNDELYELQGKMMGPIYPFVFTALQYEKPKKIKLKTKISKEAKWKKLRKKYEKENLAKKAAMEAKAGTTERVLPLRPIIDTRIFIGEIDSGRYPSMKRDKDRVHATVCCICKIEESSESTIVPPPNDRILSCLCCPNVVHFSCFLTKFTLNEPEVDDEFMCHNCIQTVNNRRNRAEKRRIERLIATKKNIINQKIDINSSSRITHGILTKGKEYECLAAQGRRINDVAELLHDAQIRLSQLMEIAKINSCRMDMIGEIEQKNTI